MVWVRKANLWAVSMWMWQGRCLKDKAHWMGEEKAAGVRDRVHPGRDRAALGSVTWF